MTMEARNANATSDEDSRPQSAEHIELQTVQGDTSQHAPASVDEFHPAVAAPGSQTSMANSSASSISVPSNPSIIAPIASIREPKTPSTLLQALRVSIDDIQDGISVYSLDEASPTSDDNSSPGEIIAYSIEEPVSQSELSEVQTFDNYYEYLESPYSAYPELRAILLKQPTRGGPVSIEVIDCGANGFLDMQAFQVQDLPAQDSHDLATQNVPVGLDLRVILAEDLDVPLIENFGSYFDLDPEFFLVHLQGSDHARYGSDRFDSRQVPPERAASEKNNQGNQNNVTLYYVDPTRKEAPLRISLEVSKDLNVKAMRATFRSFYWYRPVVICPLKETQRYYSRRFSESRICRLQHWEFGADESMGASVDHRRRRPMAFWRERISVCELDLDDCRVGVY